MERFFIRLFAASAVPKKIRLRALIVLNTLTYARGTLTRFKVPVFLPLIQQSLEEVNMFQISPSSYNSEFSRRKLSPVASLNPNACPRFSVQMASARQINSDTSKNSYKRATHNPLLQRQSHGEQDRRRQIFLKKVRQVSDDKKWESRSEQVRAGCS